MGLYLWLMTGIPLSHITFITVKQAFNGILYTTLGELCVVALPSLWHLKGKLVNHTRRTFSVQLSYLFILFTTISLLISSLMFNHYFMDKQQMLFTRNLDDTGISLSHATETYIRTNTNTNTIASIAKLVSIVDAPFNNWQDLLSSVESLSLSFSTLFIANEKGEITAASPPEKLQYLNQQFPKFTINNRDYFTQSFDYHNTYVSPAFIGQSLGNEIVIVISAPILKGHTNIPIGIVGGSLDLSYFSSIDKQNRHHQTQSIVLLDDKNNIVYASERLGLKPLTPFTYTTGSAEYNTRLNLMNIKQINAKIPEYIYTHNTLNNGWQIYVVEPFLPLLKLAQKQYANTMILLLIGMFIAILVAKAISRLTTTPLALLAQHFNQAKDGKMNGEKFEHPLFGKSTPKEIYSLYKSLEANQQALLSYQSELEEKVQQRTIDLEIANQKLQEMAERDPLTNLYNRRYTEQQFLSIQELCERAENAIAVVLLDLDFFKKVNDTYGHLAGDECLRVMAQVLSSHFKRDVDLLCRYGGEEFVLVLPMCNALNVEEHLNQFRERLAKQIITDPATQKSFSVTVSIGALIADASYNASLDVWLKQADENLYRAKDRGRNCIVCTHIIEPT
ncbi:sensor domain-containing diguanylate cyclase [Shewanella sp. CG12_big_fil_rev_8_21_14_0_65_47_15]|uniref:sensor domain-containing diguanylate cyclase n=1 Tax=Shewanella sp. CG12_big_fil_rev_8_21_14_0_65_47_15 TaxID=1975537 RepID=UPI0025FA1205|nr:sensor domain-containing diguanylate cyclase [Shewanella sp. CG12_big_fil_rev_8_21_14_0_65_47_15]